MTVMHDVHLRNVDLNLLLPLQALLEERKGVGCKSKALLTPCICRQGTASCCRVDGRFV